MTRTFIWSEDPYRDMWMQLRLLKQEANARSLLLGQIAPSRPLKFSAGAVVDRKARQLALAMAQADEYFEASSMASLATSPLMLFYGMLSLAKAAVVANDSKLRNNAPGGHCSLASWRTVASIPGVARDIL